MAFKDRQRGGQTVALLILLFYVAWIVTIVWGYVLNVKELLHATGLSGMIIARAVGLVVFPLGALLGFFA